MRATNHKNSNSRTEVTGAKASGKCRTAFKVTSTACVAMLAAAAMILPTTTLAPGVIAQTDSRVASYSIGDISKFSGCISKNCAPNLVAPVTQTTKAVPNTTVAIPAVTVQPTAAQATTKSATTAATAATAAKSKVKTTVKPTVAQTTKAAGKPVAEASGPRTQTKKQYDIVSYDYDDEDYSYSYDDNDDYSESYSDSYSYSYNDDYDDDDGYSYDDYDYDYQYSYTGDYNNDDDDYSSATQSTTQAKSSSQSSYSSNALIAISNPDYSYSPSHVSLSSYDRAKLERLVMGEAGTMGYTGCAVVAQAIRDSMNRSNTSSIDRIISEYQYFGSTNIAPNADVKAAVSFIFDQDGIAVQHRVMCFYIGYSPWHETQTFLTEIDGVRFFDLNVA